MNDLISRQSALYVVASIEPGYDERANSIENARRRRTTRETQRRIANLIDKLPTAQQETKQTDCTDFVRWLMDVVLDEEDWRMNAEAYGEIICRKLRKLGLIDVDNGYYVEKEKTGKWVIVHGYVTPGGDPVWKCSECGKGQHVYGIEVNTYGADIAEHQWVSCPNCGAVMVGEEE